MDFKIFFTFIISLDIIIILLLSASPTPKPVHLFCFQIYSLIQRLHFSKHYLQNAFRLLRGINLTFNLCPPSLQHNGFSCVLVSVEDFEKTKT